MSSMNIWDLSEDYGNLSGDHSGWKTIDLEIMFQFEAMYLTFSGDHLVPVI